MTEADHRPDPQAAYGQWVAACAAAGWRGDPVVEQVPVREGLGRVAAAAARARWAAPRFACAAMDGIAVAAASVASAAVEAGQHVLPAVFTWIDTGDPLPAGTSRPASCSSPRAAGWRQPTSVPPRRAATRHCRSLGSLSWPSSPPGTRSARSARSSGQAS